MKAHRMYRRQSFIRHDALPWLIIPADPYKPPEQIPAYVEEIATFDEAAYEQARRVFEARCTDLNTPE